MKAGVFMMPSHPPERSFYDGHQWDLDHLELVDQLGFNEAWLGEHFTAPWEPNPAPDLLIAQGLQRTQNIKLCPGAHLLPYHHPAELAHRVAFMDHIAQGRFMFGVGTSGLPSDWKLFNVDGAGGENRRMTKEALDIILKLWASEEPFEFKGEYWTVNRIDTMLDTLKFHIKPFQQPHPPIGIAGLTPGSDTLKMCGASGFMPMSVALSNGYLKPTGRRLSRERSLPTGHRPVAIGACRARCMSPRPTRRPRTGPSTACWAAPMPNICCRCSSRSAWSVCSSTTPKCRIPM